MTVLFAAGVALLGVLTAIGHTVIGERRIFGPLAREDQQGVLAPPRAQRIMRAVWHLPSLTWALLGLAVLSARLNGGDLYVTAIAAIIYGVSGAANLTALRMPHFGGLMLLAAAALTLADWRFA